MSTRCLIGVEYEDKSIVYIYCHHDGYIEHVGKILKENYSDIDSITKLLSLGNLSSLGRIPENKAQDLLKDAMKKWMLNRTIENQVLVERAIAAELEYCDAYGGDDEVACEVKGREEYINTQSDASLRYLFDGNTWLVQRYREKEFKAFNPTEKR